MCSIATDWSHKLEQLNQWLPLALLALNTVFGILLNIQMDSFMQQVKSNANWLKDYSKRMKIQLGSHSVTGL